MILLAFYMKTNVFGRGNKKQKRLNEKKAGKQLMYGKTSCNLKSRRKSTWQKIL